MYSRNVKKRLTGYKILCIIQEVYTVNSKSFEGTARTADRFTDHKLAGEIASLMNTKYEWSDGLIIELTPYKEVER
jgi:hypothetical protein